MHQIYLNYMANDFKRKMAKGKETSEVKNVNREVIVGDPEKIILSYIAEKNINLVVMTSHGTSGFRNGNVGNVADKILRESGIPALLIRIKETEQEKLSGISIKKILMPVDNSETSKVCIPYGKELAKKLGASITLFNMAQTVYAQSLDGVGAGIGVNWDTVDAATLKHSQDFLAEIEKDIKADGIEVESSTLVGMDAAYEILEIERKIGADLVVMATRGRSQIARWAFGSVAEKVLREGNLPILLVRGKTG